MLVTHFYDDSSPVPPACEGCAAGVTALVTAPFNVAGTAAADWIIADSKGNANVLLIGGADVLPSPATAGQPSARSSPRSAPAARSP